MRFFCFLAHPYWEKQSVLRIMEVNSYVTLLRSTEYVIGLDDDSTSPNGTQSRRTKEEGQQQRAGNTGAC